MIEEEYTKEIGKIVSQKMASTISLIPLACGLPQAKIGILKGFIPLAGSWGSAPGYLFTFAQLSFKPTTRLKTGCSGVESWSLQK